jgi:hypothetical protein
MHMFGYVCKLEQFKMCGCVCVGVCVSFKEMCVCVNFFVCLYV